MLRPLWPAIACVVMFQAPPLAAEVLVSSLDMEWHLVEKPRRFVTIARGARDESLPWRSLTSRPYDRVEVADAPDLDSPMTVTLIGTGGTRVTRSASVLYFAEPGEDVMRTVLEIDAPDINAWTVALRGEHATATWVTTPALEVDVATMAWAFLQQLRPHVARAELDSELEIIHGVTSAHHSLEVLVRSRRAGTLVSRHAGQWIGTFAVDGTVYLALDVGLRSVEIVPVRTPAPVSSRA